MPRSDDIAAFWDRQPCNVKHGSAPVGTREWSDQVTQRKYFVEPHIREFADFDLWLHKDVLEIGCGIGTDSLEFLRAGVNRLDAVDVSMESLRLAYNRAELYQGQDASFTRMDAQDELPWNKYDLIYSFGVIHHMQHPDLVLRAAWDRLKPDGELRIMVYAKYSLKKLLGQQPEAQAGCPLVKWYSGWEARRLLWNCGYRVVSIHKTHIFPWRLADYKAYRYIKAWPWRWMPGPIFRILERMMGTHLLIVAKKT